MFCRKPSTSLRSDSCSLISGSRVKSFALSPAVVTTVDVSIACAGAQNGATASSTATAYGANKLSLLRLIDILFHSILLARLAKRCQARFQSVIIQG